MANRGICGSLSSTPVEMGACGAAYVNIIWWLLFGFWRDGLYEDDDDEGFF